MGLCSGSDNSHRAAVVDRRVVGSVHLDGYGYRTPAYYAHFYAPRLASRRFLQQKLTARLREPSAPAGAAVNTMGRTFPPIERVAKELAALMSAMFAFFTSIRGESRGTRTTVANCGTAFPPSTFGIA